MSFADLLDARSWTLCHEPFPHVRAQNVFKPAVYRELETAFATILADRDWPSWPGVRFTRSIPSFDASAISLDTRVGPPFDVFVSRPWQDLFARLFGIEPNGYMGGGLHHHAPASKSGWVHSDFNPAWFAAGDGSEEIVVPRAHLCNYCTGPVPGANVPVREMMRGVAIIYYLNNPEWQPGDGGETGLYRAVTDNVARPVVAVPPVNNSLVAFECSPRSFHSSITNRGPRNSIIVWVHQERAAAVAKWGESNIEQWR
jgi:hypothetical protein